MDHRQKIDQLEQRVGVMEEKFENRLSRLFENTLRMMEGATPKKAADGGMMEGATPKKPADGGMMEGATPKKAADGGMMEGATPKKPADGGDQATGTPGTRATPNNNRLKDLWKKASIHSEPPVCNAEPTKIKDQHVCKTEITLQMSTSGGNTKRTVDETLPVNFRSLSEVHTKLGELESAYQNLFSDDSSDNKGIVTVSCTYSVVGTGGNKTEATEDAAKLVLKRICPEAREDK